MGSSLPVITARTVLTFPQITYTCIENNIIMAAEEKVLNALRRVNDPDIKKDLVTLNMIRDVQVQDNTISFTVVLTTPACPLKELIRKNCVQAIQEDFGPDVTVNIEMTADVTSVRNSQLPVLPNVKNIICVASGKGGVGKSTVAVNLALALAQSGAQVGIIDADIHGPSIPMMLGVRGVRPEVRKIKEKHYIVPLEAQGIKILSIGLLIDEKQAVVWRGPMVTSALKQFVTDCLWGKLDYMIVDMPPGTGDVHLTIASTVQVTGVVLVSTPQEVALADAQKALSMFRLDTMNVPILGIVENMAWFSPAELPENKYYLFGFEGAKRMAESYELPLLAQIPLIQGIREGGDTGQPAALSDNPAMASYWQELAAQVARQVAIRNEQKKQLTTENSPS